MTDEPFDELLTASPSIRTSAPFKELAAAVVSAQSKFTAAMKNAENPAYARGGKNAKYADLSAVIEATLGHLNAEGIAVMQHPSLSGNIVTVVTRLQHKSGEWMESELSIPAGQPGARFDAQTVGSAITYGCRYALQSICCVPREDDDGNAAAGIGSKEQQQEVAKRKIEELQKPRPRGAISYYQRPDGTLVVNAPDAQAAQVLEKSLGGIFMKNQMAWAVPASKLPQIEELALVGYTIAKIGAPVQPAAPPPIVASGDAELQKETDSQAVGATVLPIVQAVKGPKQGKKGVFYVVTYGGQDYFVFDAKIAGHLAGKVGKTADLEVKPGKYPAITAIHRLDGVEFMDGEPVATPNEPGKGLF